MPTKHAVRLSDDERRRLDRLTRTGRAHARTACYSRALLLVDEATDAPAWSDEKAADALGVSVRTVARVRKQFLAEGLDEAVRPRRETPGRPPKIDGLAEAHLVALACSQPPEGRATWSLRLLADAFVALGVSEPVSHETVRLTLKKNALQPHRVKQWVGAASGPIPPGQSATFVADPAPPRRAGERVLALYSEPYDAAHPVVCFDERPCVLHDDVRTPLPMRPGSETAPPRQAVKQDHEYVRGGTCCILAAFEPLRAWRRVWALPQRRRVEFAAVVQTLCDEVYPDAERVRLVCDNLNTHGPASFYEAFAPAEARRLAAKVEFVHTPVHGSWLNAVEVELSVLVRQYLG